MRPDELGAVAIKGALERVPGLDPASIDDVIIGCAMPEGEQGLNVARVASLRAGIPVESSAATINRFCSSGLQAIALRRRAIMLGMDDVVIAGGVESMSMVPMTGNKISPNPAMVSSYPDPISAPGSWPRITPVSPRCRATNRTRSHCAAISARSARSKRVFRERDVPVTVRVVNPPKADTTR